MTRPLQRVFVVHQERQLRDAALAQARRLPGAEIKDYRKRHVQTLFGRVTLSVPRLRTPNGSRLLVNWPKHCRAHPEFDFIRTQFCAWMSFGKAQDMSGRLFPLNAGVSSSTMHRRIEPDQGDVTYFTAPASMTEACVNLGKAHVKSAGWTPATTLVAFTDGG